MQVKVGTPCSESWDRMRGDARSRYCNRCALHVYNLSAMSRDEAEALIREKEGRLCVRFFQRRDGTVMTRDCPVGQRDKLIRRFSWAGAAAAFAALTVGVAAALSAGSGSVRKGSYPPVIRTVMKWLGHKEPPARILMGDFCAPGPPLKPTLPGEE